MTRPISAAAGKQSNSKRTAGDSVGLALFAIDVRRASAGAGAFFFKRFGRDRA